jgi:hypothetical protein
VAEKLVHGYPGAQHKGFQSRGDALEWLAEVGLGSEPTGPAAEEMQAGAASMPPLAPGIGAQVGNARKKVISKALPAMNDEDSQNMFDDDLDEALLSDDMDDAAMERKATESIGSARSAPPTPGRAVWVTSMPGPVNPMTPTRTITRHAAVPEEDSLPLSPPPPYTSQIQTTFGAAQSSTFLVNPVRGPPQTTFEALSSDAAAPIMPAVAIPKPSMPPVEPPKPEEPPKPLSEEQQRALDLILRGENVRLPLAMAVARFPVPHTYANSLL